MKVIRIISYALKDAFKSVFRNFSLSLASITCITITLIVVALSMIVSYNVNNFANLIKKDVTVVVFLKRGITEESINNLSNKIRSQHNIETVTFESKMKALEEMKASNDALATILSTWDTDQNPLYDRFLVKVIKIEQIKETAALIKSYEDVEIVKYGEDMVDKLITSFKVLERISYGMVAALIIVTAFLISNTIKLTIFSRKREIEIMRLVGGSNIFIKLPFVIEGCVLGVIGSAIPIIITIYGYTALYDFYGGELFSKFIKLTPPTPFVFIISSLLLIVGILVGMIGSSSSVRKHLKI